MCPTASFCERGTDIDRGNLVADLFLFFVGNSVGHHNTAEAAVVDVIDGITSKYAVDDNGVDFLGTVLHHRIGCFNEGSAGIGHVVNDNGNLVLNVANKHHSGNFVGARTFLVDQGELRIQPVSESGGSDEKEKRKQALVSRYTKE